MVIGSTAQIARIWARTSRISIHDMRSLREATDTNSFRTWTLIVPQWRAIPLIGLCRVCRQQIEHDIGVEEVFTPLICYYTVELEVRRQSTTVLAYSGQQVTLARRLLDRKGTVAPDVDVNEEATDHAC